MRANIAAGAAGVRRSRTGAALSCPAAGSQPGQPHCRVLFRGSAVLFAQAGRLHPARRAGGAAHQAGQAAQQVPLAAARHTPAINTTVISG